MKEEEKEQKNIVNHDVQMGNVELLNGVEMVWGSLWVGCICHTLKKSHFILSMLVHTKKESGPKPGSTYMISSE